MSGFAGAFSLGIVLGPGVAPFS